MNGFEQIVGEEHIEPRYRRMPRFAKASLAIGPAPNASRQSNEGGGFPLGTLTANIEYGILDRHFGARNDVEQRRKIGKAHRN